MNTFRIVLSHSDVEGQILGLYPFLTSCQAAVALGSSIPEVSMCAAGPGQRSFSIVLPTTHAQRSGGPASTGSRPPLPGASLTSVYVWFQETLLKMSKQEWRTFLGFRA